MPDLGNQSVATADFNFLWKDEAGISTYMRDNGDGTTSFLKKQDLAPVLDALSEHRNNCDGYTPSREMRKIAHLPALFIDHCIGVEGWDPTHPDNIERLCRVLNDPDYAFLRYSDGQVGMSNGVMR